MSEFINSDFSTSTAGADLNTFTGSAGETWTRFPSLAANPAVFTATTPVRMRPGTADNYTFYYATQPAPASDYSVTLKGRAVGAPGSDQYGVYLRLNPLNGEGYWCCVQGTTLSITSGYSTPPTVASGTIPEPPSGDFTIEASCNGSTFEMTYTPAGGLPYTISGTDTYTSAAGHVGWRYYRHGAVDDTNSVQFDSLTAGSIVQTGQTYPYSSPQIAYLGRWHDTGTEMVTINNGAELRFGYTGDHCALNFDVSGQTYRPTVAVWVDDQGPTRIPLPGNGVVNVTPAYTLATNPTSQKHFLRVQANVDSGYTTGSANWSVQGGALKLKSVTLDANQVLLAGAVPADTIEFIGDSLTAALRALWTNTGEGVAFAAPEMGFPDYVSAWLGLAPVVSAHGGQGYTAGGTDASPAFTTFNYPQLPVVCTGAPR
jgi:hypothetical protein